MRIGSWRRSSTASWCGAGGRRGATRSQRGPFPRSRREAGSRLEDWRFRGQAFGVFVRLQQAPLVGQAFARDVEGGAVVDGGADDRQAEGDVDAGEVVPPAGGRVDL